MSELTIQRWTCPGCKGYVTAEVGDTDAAIQADPWCCYCRVREAHCPTCGAVPGERCSGPRRAHAGRTPNLLVALRLEGVVR